MTMRFFAGSILAALAVALLWPRDQATGTHDQAAGTHDQPATAAGVEAPRSSSGSWTSLHRGGTVQANLAGISEWLAATYPTAEPAFLGVDCTSPPCLIGMRFTGQRLTPEQVRELWAGVRQEVERRTGIAMSVVHIDEDSAGRDYLWMYGLPAELPIEDRETQRQSAEARYMLRMDPLRKPSDPHVTTGPIGN